jgi:hypothetical protein
MPGRTKKKVQRSGAFEVHQDDAREMGYGHSDMLSHPHFKGSHKNHRGETIYHMGHPLADKALSDPYGRAKPSFQDHFVLGEPGHAPAATHEMHGGRDEYRGSEFQQRRADARGKISQ